MDRWQICVEQTDNIYGLGYAVSRIFIRKSPNNIKKFAEALIESIKKGFINNFRQIPWMNKKTRILAEDKVNNVANLIGYPDFIEDDKKLNQLLVYLLITFAAFINCISFLEQSDSHYYYTFKLLFL